MNKVILDPTHIRQQAIDDELLVDHSALAENAGFLTGVAVTKAVYHGVIGISSKSVDDHQLLFLQVCSAQTKIALTDYKQWQRIRFYYPIPTSDGFFIPKEVVIKCDINHPFVTIMLASEEGTQLFL